MLGALRNTSVATRPQRHRGGCASLAWCGANSRYLSARLATVALFEFMALPDFIDPGATGHPFMRQFTAVPFYSTERETERETETEEDRGIRRREREKG